MIKELQYKKPNLLGIHPLHTLKLFSKRTKNKDKLLKNMQTH